MNRITTNNIINAITSEVDKKTQPKQIPLTPEQQCLERANARIKEAQRHFLIKFKAFKDTNGVPPTFNEAVEMIYPLLRTEFANWSKDDFATLACMTLAITAAHSLSDYTI